MNSDYLKTWIAKADNDLMIINHELQLPESEWVTDMICFHCQQAAEKYLKALLIYQDKEIPGRDYIMIITGTRIKYFSTRLNACIFMRYSDALSEARAVH